MAALRRPRRPRAGWSRDAQLLPHHYHNYSRCRRNPVSQRRWDAAQSSLMRRPVHAVNAPAAPAQDRWWRLIPDETVRLAAFSHGVDVSSAADGSCPHQTCHWHSDRASSSCPCRSPPTSRPRTTMFSHVAPWWSNRLSSNCDELNFAILACFPDNTES